MAARRIIRSILYCSGLAVSLVSSTNGHTFYVATDGNNAGSGASSQPWATFSHAFSIMAGGDTLIIKDGTYRQDLRYYYGDGLPPGSTDHYTVVKAEHDWQVNVAGRLKISGNNPGYIHIQGIHFTVNGDEVDGHHLKFIRCSFCGDVCTDNTAVTGVGSGSSYILFEECFAYGCGRYKFLLFGDEGGATQNIILRRCVSRHDYHDPAGWGFQCATFTSYDCHNLLMQNCISINSGSDNGSSSPAPYGYLYGGLWMEHKQTTGQDNSARLQGCVFLDIGGSAAINDPKNDGIRRIENVVIWDSKGGYGGGAIGGSPTVVLQHMTIGKIWGSFGDESYAWGTAAYAGSGFAASQITNSILMNCHSYGIADYMTSDYNAYYGNAADFGHTYGKTAPVAGIHDRLSTSPGLRYICRVENDSPLKGAASDGGDIGANVMYRYGVSGTLWGEPGYDSLLDEPLWPFPNEDVVKSTMSSWTGQNNAKRGFCADGKGLYGGPITLTSYIWEYLGNPCPPEICGNAKIRVAPLPKGKNILKCCSNPLSQAATISIELPALRPGNSLKLSIYNAAGRDFATLADGPLSPGKHIFTWRAKGNPAGIYLVRLQAGSEVQQRKLIIIR